MANTMTLELVEQMVKNYKDKQYQSIIDNKDNPMTFDAQSVRFTLNSLKNFIQTIEDEVALHPEFDLQNLGIRFYYAAYPDSTSWGDSPGLNDVPPGFEKLHTLIAIPSAENSEGSEFDFDPFDVATYNGKKPTDGSLTIMAENHGPLTPPGSSSGLWF